MRLSLPIISLVCSLLFFSSCQNEAKFCEVNKLAQFCFFNQTLDTVTITMDGVLQTYLLPDGDFCEFYQTGPRAFVAKPLDMDTCWTDTILVSTCQVTNVALYY